MRFHRKFKVTSNKGATVANPSRKRTFLGKLAAAVALTLALTVGGNASAQSPAGEQYSQTSLIQAKTKLSTEDIVERLKLSTCLLNLPGKSSGTGWVLDLDKRLVVTNQHVIASGATIHAYFPEKKGGEWVNDVNHYLRFVKPITATIIASDIDSDLALLQLDSLPKEVKAIPMSAKSPGQGSRLHSIGGKTLGSDVMWTYTLGHVRQVGNGTTALSKVTRVVEAQMEYNKGNSGGPIVNDYGELVAVVEGYRISRMSGGQVVTVRNVSIAIDVKQVKTWLKDVLPLVDPKTAKQFVDRGNRHLEEGRYNQAIRDLSDAIRKDSKLGDAYAKRGWAFHRKGDNTTALGDFDEALKINSSNDDAHYGRGMANRSLNKTKEALRDFTSAIRLRPDSWRYYNQRGIIYYRSKDYQPAYDDFDRALKNNDKVAVLWENKGIAAINLRLYKTGAEAYEQAIKLNPDLSTSHNYQGVCYYRLGDNKKAAEKFLDAIKRNSKRSLYHENLGNALQKLGDHKAAVIAFDNAIKIEKTGTSLMYFNRGYSQYMLRDYSEATKDFTTAISKDSKNADAYYYRGRAYKARGLSFQASSDFRKATQLNPKKYPSGQ